MMFERYGVPRGLAPHRSRTIRPVALASTIYCASLVGIRHPSRSDLVRARSVTVVTSSSPGSSRCQRCPACRFRSAFSAPLDAGSTLNVMEKRFPLATPKRKRLWTREVPRPLRESQERIREPRPRDDRATKSQTRTHREGSSRRHSNLRSYHQGTPRRHSRRTPRRPPSQCHGRQRTTHEAREPRSRPTTYGVITGWKRAVRILRSCVTQIFLL